jgi:hypothetical protein
MKVDWAKTGCTLMVCPATALSFYLHLRMLMLDMLKNVEETSFGFIDDSFEIKFRGAIGH